MKTIRASSIDRILKCPPSSIEPAVKIESADDGSAALGDAVHEASACMVMGDAPDIDAIAMHHEVGASEVDRLYRKAQEQWMEISTRFPADVPVVVEQSESVVLQDGAVTMTRHADVLAEENGYRFVVDWKTKRREDYGEHEQQMNAYVYPQGFAFVAWLQHGQVEFYRKTEDQLQAWRIELVDKVINPDRYPYKPDENTCRFCPRRHECPALQQMQRAGVNAMVQVKEGSIVRAEDIVQAFKQKKMIQKVIATFEGALKLQAAAGPIVGDEDMIVLKTVVKKPIDARKAWPIVAEHLSEDEFAPAVTLAKGKLVDAVRAKTAGKKIDAERAFLADLKAVDAFGHKPQYQLELKRRDDL